MAAWALSLLFVPLGLNCVYCQGMLSVCKLHSFFFFGCAGSSLLHKLFSSYSKQGYSLVTCVRFSLWWFLVAELRLWGLQASIVVALRLQSTGSVVVVLGLSCGMRGLPRSGTKPTSPALAAAAKSIQSCPTLCDPIDSSPPGSPVPGILQARTLEWVAISFSNA